MSRTTVQNRPEHHAAFARPKVVPSQFAFNPSIPTVTPFIQRKSQCACGGNCPRCREDELPVQAKLKISQPNDKYEQEADRMAEQVMRMPESATQRQTEPEVLEEEETVQTKPLADQATPLVQRQVEPEEQEEEEETLQAKPEKGQATMSPGIHHSIKGLQGGGRPLPEPERRFFEPRFGRDVSNVRIHTGSRAAESAQGISARAFTIGRDIAFAHGEYAPQTDSGKRLLAHELVHVFQQGSSSQARRMIMRDTYPGCDQATTNVRNTDAIVNRGRSDAIAMVNRALAALRAPNSHTLLLLDRHFHCPASWQIRHIIRGFTQIRDELPNITNIRCRSSTDTFCSNPMRMGGRGESPLDLPQQEFENLSPEELERGFEIADSLNLCPRFFNTTDDSRRAVTFMIHAGPIGYSCMKRESCYDDFYVPASNMIQNPFSYAWFAVELSGHPVRRPSIIPCRPINTGTNVVVPPAAGSNPRLIRRLSGFDPTSAPGSVILQLYVDRSRRYFVYYDGPAAGQYRQGERPRLYLPEGWSP